MAACRSFRTLFGNMPARALALLLFRARESPEEAAPPDEVFSAEEDLGSELMFATKLTELSAHFRTGTGSSQRDDCASLICN